VLLLESGVDTADPSVRSPQLRKQVGDLTPSDLEQYPTWEFALDEGGEEGQDEETVRPRPEVEFADPGEGLFIVRAEFAAADGTSPERLIARRDTGFVSANDGVSAREASACPLAPRPPRARLPSTTACRPRTEHRR
jgi:hypothetical protein